MGMAVVRRYWVGLHHVNRQPPGLCAVTLCAAAFAVCLGWRTPQASTAVVCQGGSNTKRQCFRGHGVRYIEDDGAVAFECELTGEQGFESLDQRGLAIEVDRVVRG